MKNLDKHFGTLMGALIVMGSILISLSPIIFAVYVTYLVMR